MKTSIDGSFSNMKLFTAYCLYFSICSSAVRQTGVFKVASESGSLDLRQQGVHEPGTKEI